MAASDIISYLSANPLFNCLPQGQRILDFGCGNGRLVMKLRELGWDAHGVDISTLWDSKMKDVCHEFLPGYRIPFKENYFDLVVSTSVLEHVQNKLEAFYEIQRILKPRGYAIHAFPSKFFLPLEPHIKVPFVSWLHPHVPGLYLTFFALMGFRNIHQRGFSWREVQKANTAYIRDGLNYWTRRRYLECLGSIYSESRFDDTYAGCGVGTVAQIDQRISNRYVRAVWRSFATLFRNQLLLCQK